MKIKSILKSENYSAIINNDVKEFNFDTKTSNNFGFNLVNHKKQIFEH